MKNSTTIINFLKNHAGTVAATAIGLVFGAVIGTSTSTFEKQSLYDRGFSDAQRRANKH